MSYIRTYTGKKFSLTDPQPEDVCIEDIIHALSQIVRYTGHCQGRYTVLQHSCHVAQIVETKEDRWQGLLHDAPEAYYGDDSSPKKEWLDVLFHGEYSKALRRIDDVVFQALGVPWPMTPAVQYADLKMCATEFKDFMAGEVDRDGPSVERKELPTPLDVELTIWTPSQSETRFLELYNTLRP